jgi:hypothetical protein
VKRLLFALFIAATVFPLQSAEEPDWSFEAFIRVPYPNTLFLARDSSDNVYVTTFNSSSKPREVVAFKISNALSSRPQVTAFDKFMAPPNRGYSGVTVDDGGNIYLSADQGDGQPSFIKKFTSNLDPDPTFGSTGVLATTKLRILGLTSYKRKVLAGVSWGRFLEIDSSGRFLGITPELPREQQALIRDIDFLPDTEEVVGVDRDSVYIFTGGTLRDLSGYHLRSLAHGSGPPLSGAGIYYNPHADRIYYTINQGHTMGSIRRTAPSHQTIASVGVEQGVSQPADAVVSSDGKTLFVSDLSASQIVRYRSGQLNAIVSVPSSVRKVISAGETVSTAAAKAPATPVAAALTPNLETPAATPVATAEAAPVASPNALPEASPFTGFASPVPTASSAIPTTATAIATPESIPGIPAAVPTLPAPATAPIVAGLPPPANLALSPATSATANVVTATATFAAATTAPAVAATPMISGAPAAQQTESSAIPWSDSPETAFAAAQQSGKPVVIFFFSPESETSREIDDKIFSSKDFAARHNNIMWARVDVTQKPEVMATYNFFKVPIIIIFTPDKKEVKRVEGAVTEADMEKELAAVK